jgi:hypothetical protein
MGPKKPLYTVVVKVSATALESSVEVPQESKPRLTICYRNTPPGYISEGM